jgi:hypothetical protein
MSRDWEILIGGVVFMVLSVCCAVRYRRKYPSPWEVKWYEFSVVRPWERYPWIGLIHAIAIGLLGVLFVLGPGHPWITARLKMPPGSRGGGLLAIAMSVYLILNYKQVARLTVEAQRRYFQWYWEHRWVDLLVSLFCGLIGILMLISAATEFSR